MHIAAVSNLLQHPPVNVSSDHVDVHPQTLRLRWCRCTLLRHQQRNWAQREQHPLCAAKTFEVLI